MPRVRAGVHVAPRGHGDHLRLEGLPQPLDGRRRPRRRHRHGRRVRRRAGRRAGRRLPRRALHLPRQQQGRGGAARGDRRRHRPHHRRQLPRAGAARPPRPHDGPRAADHPPPVAGRRRAHAREDHHRHARHEVRAADLDRRTRSRRSPKRSGSPASTSSACTATSARRSSTWRRTTRRTPSCSPFAAEMREEARPRSARVQPRRRLRGAVRPREARARTSTTYAEAIVSSFKRRCEENGLPLPHLFVEPGRSLVARAGVALYTVGARKEVEGLRTWVSVDGGMADNIRPAIYDAPLRGRRRQPRRRRARPRPSPSPASTASRATCS